LLFYFNNIVTKNFSATCAKEKSVSNSLHIHLIEIIMQNFFGGNPFVDGIIGHSLLLSRAFFGGNPFVGVILGHNLLLSLAFFGWESLRGWDFSRPQLVVVSGLFLHDGIQAITKPLSRTFFFFFHDGILAITKPFSRTFSFFTMGFWLSRSLSHELFLFSRWDSGYHEAFLTNFFGGILAITKPFSRTFSFFTVGFWLSQSLSHELFSFFTMELWKYAIWGKTLFIHMSQRVFT
jgi:hypothetical protein